MTLTTKTMELHGKIQKWIESIMLDKLENTARESKGLPSWELDSKLNKLIFKALLCLSHTAERSKPFEIQIGKQIFDITDSLCYALTEIPDLIKYFSSLYHIARKLIAMQLYSEAMRVTAWSFPSNLVRDLTSQHLDMYPKIANLWHEPAVNLIDTFPHGFSKNDHELLLEFLSNELKVLEVIARERSMFVLCRIIRYLTKLDAIPKSFKLKGNKNHRYVVGRFLERIKVFFVGVEKYEVYYEALRSINLATSAVVTPDSLENAPAVFTESCDILATIFSTDTELSRCFLLYKNMCIRLLKPVDNSQKNSHWKLERIKKEAMDIINDFGHGKGISWNMKMVGYILQSLFEHWENCVSIRDERFLNSALLRDLLGLIKLMFFILNSFATNGCEICHEDGCKIKKNIYTVTVVSIRCLVTLSKVPAGDLLKDIFSFVRELLEENVAAIYEMKESDCAQWSVLWNNCGINIYNLSVACHKVFYEETAFLFSLLCSCIVRFEGINAVNSKINIKNPLPNVLHRLSSVHFNHGNYREALTPCALNGLLSYQNPDSKAFRMWASIKHACANSRNILKMTMLSCLREDMDVISEIGVIVNLRDYDLSQLCLHELRGLHEARCNLSIAMQSALDELQILDSRGLEYVHGVHLLGYHLLHYQYDKNFPRYLERAIKKLKEDKFAGDLHVLAEASLDFYTFIMNLNKISEQTKAEMETAKFALRATKTVTHEGQLKNNDTVVPAYTKINVAEDSKLFSSLQQALNKWKICVENGIIGIIEEWHLVLTLRTLILIGEYCRLHKFSTLETTAWKIAYKIACQLKDSRTCVYVVGRSTALRNVNTEWINTGNEFTTELQSSREPDTDNAIALFWVALSNLYFEIGKHEEAAEILQRVLAIPNISPLNNVPGYLLSMDAILKNDRFHSNDNRSTKYMVYIVRSLYSMLSLMEYSPTPRVGVKEKRLYISEVLLTCTAHLSLRMNSLLSFKEISSHLINRLKYSQASGATLRAADCLKNLCLIDLSRMQLDDCVVKVQGLEYILQIEYIEESQRTKNPETSTNERDIPGSRDPCINNVSPVLRKTVFKIPEFMTHSKCSCYKCSSVDYQYLVLSSTHIRAQLYFLQGHLKEAMEHFNGAFFLRRNMLHKEWRHDNKWEEIRERKNEGKLHPWKDYYQTVEYVLLLLDFSRFLRQLEFHDAIDVAVEAVRICERFHLQGHPVYIAAKELVLEYEFCGVFTDSDFSEFTVPDPSSINISKFTYTGSSLNPSDIATPASKQIARKPKTLRRNKTPPLLKLTKVSINLSEDEDEEDLESPKSFWRRTKAGKNYGRPKSLTRKKLQECLDVSLDSFNEEMQEDATAMQESRLKVPADLIPAETAGEVMDHESITAIITQAVSTFPNLSKQLIELLDKQGMCASEKIQRVMKLVEGHGTNAESKTKHLDYGHRGKSKSYSKTSASSKSRLSNRDQDHVMDKLVASFNEILIGNKDARFSRNADEGSLMLPSVSVNDLSSRFGTDNERRDLQSYTPCTDIKVKRRLDLTECPDNIPPADKVITKLTKPENVEQKERLRTSNRIKRLWSQSSTTDRKKLDDVDIVSNLERCKSVEGKEKPKSTVRRRINSLQDGTEGISTLGNAETEKTTHDAKPNLRTLGRIGRSQSESSELIENPQFEDSDIVPTSDLDEKATTELRRNGLLRKPKTKTSSRTVRSRSQINGTSSKSQNIGNSDNISTSDLGELPETTNRKDSRQNSKAKDLSNAKKSDKRSNPSSAETSNSTEKESQKIPESAVLKELEVSAKKQVGKRPTSGRSKLKR